jgi:dTDP-4-amino-4,6-dideoxygalactose transaminase
MTVPFLDLAATHREIQAELEAALHQGLEAGQFIGGQGVSVFEREFAAWCGAGHCIGVGNGLDALTLALRGLDIGPGDEVIVPAHTFIASWLAVSQIGAVPVPVEPEMRSFNIDPDQVEQAITPRTRAIMPVHLYGHPADLGPLQVIADAHGLPLIEDAAQAHGALYRGQRIGAHGRVVCWSFYPGKNLGALGDGGAVTTSDTALATRIRMLGNYGSRQKYVHELAGCNSRLDDLQARLLSVKLRHLARWNARRQDIARRYLSGLANSGLSILPVPQDWAEPVWHLFPVFTPDRAALQQFLAAEGIATQIHYPTPPHLQGAYQTMNLPAGSLPLTERLHREELSLPIGPHMSDDQVDQVMDAVRRFFHTS